MKAKNNWWLLSLMAVLALTRWPPLWPAGMQNFSAVYALAFCAGVYFTGRSAWWIPLLTLAITDVIINGYYYFSVGVNGFQPAILFNYVAYLIIIGLGRKFKPIAELPYQHSSKALNSSAPLRVGRHLLSWLSLVGGGILGAIVFYLVTNTASWWFNPFHNPEYTKTWGGFVIALTKGTAGWPHTWEFFRNTLLSGGLFTGLFVGAMKLTAEVEKEAEPESTEDNDPEAEPEKSRA